MRLHIRFDYPNLWKQFLWKLRDRKCSPAYTNPLQFFSAMGSQGIHKDIPYLDAPPGPYDWYEDLPLIEPNLKTK